MIFLHLENVSAEYQGGWIEGQANFQDNGTPQGWLCSESVGIAGSLAGLLFRRRGGTYSGWILGLVVVFGYSVADSVSCACVLCSGGSA